MNQELALTKQEETTATLMRRASDVAGVCKQIVLKTALQIQGRKYVRVEGWQAIATAHGCMATAKDVEKIEGGWRAIGEIRRISDGAVLCNAEGFVGTDEVKTWAQRPEYACRAMAQTRAISRVCRSAFAHVVVLMDAGLSTTPAEEVPADGFTVEAATVQPEKPKDEPTATAPSPAPQRRKEPFSLGDVTCCAATLVDFTERTGTSGKGPWTARFCSFETPDGATLEAGTFDKKMFDAIEVLKGQVVDISYKPGKKPGTFELMSISPDDNLP